MENGNETMKDRLVALKDRFVQAQTDEEAEAVSKEIAALCDEDAGQVASATLDMIRETNAEAETILVRQQIEQVLPFISLAAISEKYFKKSRAWLYQRVSGLKVNGKIAQFTEEEKQQLTYALNDIGSKLTKIRVS